MPSLDDVLDSAADEVELDLSGSVEYDDVPNGRYVGKLTKAEKGTSKAGNPVLKWFFNVEKTISTVDGAPAPKKGSFLPITTSNLDGPAAWRAKKVIKALGFDTEAAAGSNSIKFSPSKAKDRLVLVTVQQQESNPEYQELVDFQPYDETAADIAGSSDNGTADEDPFG